MVRRAAEAPPGRKWSALSDRPVKGLEKSLGRFIHGVGPGREGLEKPIPLFFQVLDPEIYYLSYRPGDERHQVLTNDQNRFSLPRSLVPVVAVLLPGDEDNPTDSVVVVRHAYSEGAFRLLQDLLDDDYRFSLKEFLRLATSLATSLAFLHAHGIVHGQWNARSVICVPVEADGTPFDSASSHRFDLLNTGIFYRDAREIPADILERGHFPEEIVPPSTNLPDFEALDVQADVYCFAAFLKDLLQRASRFEELTKQAGTIQDHLRREALRAGQKPSAEQLREKEQEILDHLYTIKLKTEEMIRDGLRGREQRAHADELQDRSADLYRRTTEYADRLFDIGFERVNVFGAELQHYVPYQVTLTPRSVNNFEETVVDLAGDGLPYELVRVSLGEWDRPMEVLASTPASLRFKVPRGFGVGSHRVFINNRRTDQRLRVETPWWIRVEPESLPKPWPGFGNISLRVLGEALPSGARYSLLPEWSDVSGEATAGGAPARRPDETETPQPVPIDALSCVVEDLDVAAETVTGDAAERPNGEAETSPGAEAPASGADAADAAREPRRLQSALLEFSPETPVGEYTVVAGGLDTGLAVRIDEALPEPVIHAVEPLEVFNHRHQELKLYGADLHDSMVVDLGEDAPTGCILRVKSDRSARLVIPRGYPAGDYPVRTNRADSGLRIVVREPAWIRCDPQTVKFRRREGSPKVLRVEGEALPAVDEESSDVYHVATKRGRSILNASVLEEERLHELRLPPGLRTGRHSILFADHATGLSVKVRRQLAPAAWIGLILCLVAILGTAGAVFGPRLADRLRPEIAALETPVVYKFGNLTARLTGARLTAVGLHDREGVEIAALPLASAGDDSGDGSYSFELSGIAPGRYRLSARGRFLAGKPCDLELRVQSPELRLQPRVIDRLTGASLELTSGSGFPFVDGSPAVLRLTRELPAADGDVAANGDRAAVSREFPLGPGGGVSVLPGTFRAGDEGLYRVFVDDRPLEGELVAAVAPGTAPEVVTVDVVGPAVEAIEPARATLDADGRIRIKLRGRRFPSGAPLGLIPAAASQPEEDAIAFRLAPRAGDAFEGSAEPGQYTLAWNLEDGVEAIPGVSLAVLPPPEVTGVRPARVRPDVPVEVEFSGVNLESAGAITLLPLARGDAVRVDLVPAGFRREEGEGSDASYLAKALVLPAGRFRVAPGEAAQIEVIEDCKEQLEIYLRDLSGRDELMSCLVGETVTDDVRRSAAGIFFDQGLFDEAHDLYASLGDVRSRFRAAFIRAFVRGQETAGFSAGPDDAPGDPYLQAAGALKWHPGGGDETFAVDGGPWELDYVSALLAPHPREAVDRLTLALERKESAAAVREIERFEPALDELASAHLDLAVALLREAAPTEALEHFRGTVMTEASFERLDEADKARCCFYAGHAALWYAGDKAAAKATLERGMLPGGLAFSSLCRLYLEALGGKVARPPPLMHFPPLPEWEQAFVDGVRGYVKVLDGPNYNILAEDESFAFQNDEERRANRELFASLKRLEAAKDPSDPFAHYGVLYFLRSAQRLAWPVSIAQGRWREHRDAFLSLELDERGDRIRSVFLIMGEAAPLAPSQIAVMPREEIVSLLERINRIDQTGLDAGFQELLRRFKQNLLGGADGSS